MQRIHFRRCGLTLVEILVVVVLVGILVSLLIPATQAARESARRAACASNIRQVATAVSIHENALGCFPSSFKTPGSATFASGNVDGWSGQVMLLPFLEHQVTQDRIDLNATFDENFAPIVNVTEGSRPISAVRVPVYLCPSEPRDEVRMEGSNPKHYPLNYGFNLGEWLVYNPATGQGGNGACYPNSRLHAKDFVDGLGNTLLLAEVRAWQPYYRNAGLATDPGRPVSPAAVCSLGGTEFKPESGHTEWVDGRAHQTGFTTVFAPNTKVWCNTGGIDFDVDWTNQQEGRSATIPTYAVVTARSHHPGLINVAMMDGAVKPVADEVERATWRAMSTRQGND